MTRSELVNDATGKSQVSLHFSQFGQTTFLYCHVPRAWGHRQVMDDMDDALPSEVASILPAYLRPAIPHQNFNKMQVECMEAWNSDCNMLVSAPTGSGKTMCFDLALLRQLHAALELSENKHLSSSGLNGKVVFIAPAKALCTERADDWKRRYAFAGLRVELMTGDVSVSASDSVLLNADVIVTTAEKWDSLTRSTGSQTASDILCQISVLLLDEVHHLGASRGGTLESVATRMLVTSDELKRNASSAPIVSLRVIAVSATVKNVKDVGTWLRVEADHIKEFDQSYRPVQLEYKLLAYHIRNPWQSAKVYDSRMLGVLRKFGDGKPALVFCPSRRQTSLSALSLLEHLNRNNPGAVRNDNELTRHLSVEQRGQLRQYAANCSDRTLASLLPSGVAVHNAEMKPENRQLVERLFRESLVLCLFSTSTLAQGVNLPARLVVIAGTAVYHDGSLQEYDRNLLIQMCGRSGRPQLDTKGVAAIMTSRSSARRYVNIEKETPSSLESQLNLRLEESFNAEIARQFITDVPSAVFFLTNTFYWIREKKKCRSEYQKDGDKLRALLTTTAVTTVNKLASMHLVRFDDDHFGVGSTSAGATMAKYCLSFETLRLLMTEIPKVSSPAGVLKVVAATPEVLDGVFVRRAEKKRLNEMNEFIRLPIRGKVKEPVDKVVILLQIVLDDNLETANTDFALHSEARRLMQAVSRVCSGLISLILDVALKAPYEAVFSVLQVCRGLINHCYWDGLTVLRQIPGVTTARAKALAKHGISTIDALSRSDFSLIDDFVSAKAPFAKRVLENLKEFPKFHVQATASRNPDDGRQISRIQVHVTVSAQIGHWKPRLRAGERGFILVGSHSRGFIEMRTFSLDKSDQQFLFHVPPDDCPRQGKWIDIIVGSGNAIATDESVRLPLEEQKDSCVNAEGAPAQTHRSNSLKERRPPGPPSKLSVTHGRVSKRFVQTTVFQALGHNGDRSIATDFPTKVAFKFAVEDKTLTSDESTPVKKPEDKSVTSPETSPDTSPGPSSPARSEPIEESTKVDMSIEAEPAKLLPREKKISQGHGRFQALYTSGKTRSCHERNSHPSVPVMKESYVNPNYAGVSEGVRADQSCREYDDMLKNLF